MTGAERKSFAQDRSRMQRQPQSESNSQGGECLNILVKRNVNFLVNNKDYMEYFKEITNHYIANWNTDPSIYLWDKGPIEKMNFDFRVLEFAPSEKRSMWTYATRGMSCIDDPLPIELHLFSHKKDLKLVELLSTVAFYHKNTAKLDLNHTVNFGVSWQDESRCTYGLLSLPYLDGPELENLNLNSNTVKFYWLLPITKSEVDYKARYGIERLEEKFDEVGIDYLNPNRMAVV